VDLEEVTLTLPVAPARVVGKRRIDVVLSPRQALVWRQFYEGLRRQGAKYRTWEGRERVAVTPGDALRVLCDILDNSIT